MNRKEQIITDDIITIVMNIDVVNECIVETEIRGNLLRYLVVNNNNLQQDIDTYIDYDELGQWFRLSIYDFARRCIEFCERLGYSIRYGRNTNNTFYAFLKTPNFGEPEKAFHDTEDSDLAIIKATKSII